MANFRFKALLKLDADALLIGPALEKDIITYFEKESMVGIAGQYPNDYHGKAWDLGWPRRRILNGVSTWRFIRRPKSNLALIPLHKRAERNGYKTGESVFGGAYFMSEQFLKDMLATGHLPNMKLAKLNLGEDHLFSMLAKTIGYSLGSLFDDGQPFSLAWKGLPVAPEHLVKEKQKIIHSVCYWQDMDEQSIRDWFAKERQRQ